MADSRLPGLDLIVTPGPTDVFGTRRVAATRDERTTRAQIHTLVSGEVITLPQEDTVTAVAVAFGDADDGWYSPSNGTISLGISGTRRFDFSSSAILGRASASAPAIQNEATTATNPVFAPSRSDLDTGAGSAGADIYSLIAGGVEAMRFTEATGVLQAVESDVGLTADVGSAQGNGIILSSFNVYSTVANIGDAATLPAEFTAGNPSTLIYIKNDGANSMDVFPASGDDAGAGANTAVAVASGDFAFFIATIANATWTKLMGGTA